jgi:hypothetical protein
MENPKIDAVLPIPLTISRKAIYPISYYDELVKILNVNTQKNNYLVKFAVINILMSESLLSVNDFFR